MVAGSLLNLLITRTKLAHILWFSWKLKCCIALEVIKIYNQSQSIFHLASSVLSSQAWKLNTQPFLSAHPTGFCVASEHKPIPEALGSQWPRQDKALDCTLQSPVKNTIPPGPSLCTSAGLWASAWSLTSFAAAPEHSRLLPGEVEATLVLNNPGASWRLQQE